MSKQRSLLIALLLTFLMPGGGHFYLRAYLRGLTVMIIFWTGLAVVVAGLTGFDYRVRISETKTIGFHVTRTVTRIYLVEIILVYLYNFVDCIRMIAQTELVNDKPFYSLSFVSSAGIHSSREIRQDTFLIGRSQRADLRLDDPTVSREHARIEAHQGHWVIRDLGSRNGIRINGIPTPYATLRSGDVIQIGNCRILFRS